MEANYENKAILTVDWSITTNVLLTGMDGKMTLNCYGETAKLIAQARILTGDVKSTKYCRFQSSAHWTHWNLITKADVDNFLQKVNNWCSKHLQECYYEDVKTTVVEL